MSFRIRPHALVNGLGAHTRSLLLSTLVLLAVLVMVVLVALSPVTVSAARQQMFGLMFPELPP